MILPCLLARGISNHAKCQWLKASPIRKFVVLFPNKNNHVCTTECERQHSMATCNAIAAIARRQHAHAPMAHTFSIYTVHTIWPLATCIECCVANWPIPGINIRGARAWPRPMAGPARMHSKCLAMHAANSCPQRSYGTLLKLDYFLQGIFRIIFEIKSEMPGGFLVLKP